jgi:hypothetical protein
MKKTALILSIVFLLLIACQPQTSQNNNIEENISETYELLGYTSKVEWGKHIVAITGCNDCHSPKIMTDMGPAVNPELLLSGHPSASLPPQIDREVNEKNGYATCNSSLTSWVGPWGISYAGNLTPDATGIGNWKEDNFSRAMREGKFKGMENGRTLLPPMPWQEFVHMTDDEISAIFAYLMSLPPIKNIVPNPDPPMLASK